MSGGLVLVGLDDSGGVALQNKCGTAVDAWISTQLSKKLGHFEGAPKDETTSGMSTYHAVLATTSDPVL